MIQYKALLIIEDPHLSALVSFAIQSEYNFDVIEKTGQDIPALQNYIADSSTILVIIYDLALNSLKLEDLSAFLEPLPTTPLIIGINHENINPLNSKALHLIKASLNKEHLLKNLIEVMQKNFTIDPNALAKDFCKVSIRTLLSFSGIENDLYIQLSSGRLIKLFSKADHINTDDIKKYLDKGLTHLCLKKDSANFIVHKVGQNIDKVISSLQQQKSYQIIKPQDAPIEKIPTPEVVDYVDPGQLTISIPEIATETTQSKKEQQDANVIFYKKLMEYIKVTLEAVKKQPRLSLSFIQSLPINHDLSQYYNVHTQLLIPISCGLAQLMDWKQEATLTKLIFVSKMHDISLSKKQHLSWIHTTRELFAMGNKISEEDKRLVLSHPELSAKFLLNLPEFPQEADKIIAQHHERPDGKGFPHQVKSNKITPLASLFICSLDLVDYIIKNPKWDLKNYLSLAQDQMTGTNFRKVLNAISQIR